MSHRSAGPARVRSLAAFCTAALAAAAIALLPAIPAAADEPVTDPPVAVDEIIPTDPITPPAEEPPAEEPPAEEPPAEELPAEEPPAEEPPAEEPPAEESPVDAVVEEGAGEQQRTALTDCNQTTEFFEQNRGMNWCMPEPQIHIEVLDYCPNDVKIKVSKLYWHWLDYTLKVGDETFTLDPGYDGKDSVELEDVPSGELHVSVWFGEHKLAYDKEWIHEVCPWIEPVVEQQCITVDGLASVEVRVGDLVPWRQYDITVTGPGFEETYSAQWTWYFEEDLQLAPGEYHVSVLSEGKHGDIGPVEAYFTVEPCPNDIVISFAPICSARDDGSLGAALSGLVPGREYSVTVEGPDGWLYEHTFVAESDTWAIPTGALKPGTYTVTVVDTMSGSGSEPVYEVLTEGDYEHPEVEPLSWTASATIASCPPVPARPASLPTLALTGEGPTTGLLPALALIPLGAGLLFAGAVRNRRKLAEVDAEE
jgi:hypothetical protein